AVRFCDERCDPLVPASCPRCLSTGRLVSFSTWYLIDRRDGPNCRKTFRPSWWPLVHPVRFLDHGSLRHVSWCGCRIRLNRGLCCAVCPGRFSYRICNWPVPDLCVEQS